MTGLRGGAVSAHRLKRHSNVRRMVELIQQHQLQRVLRGEFAAQAQTKAGRRKTRAT